jgi:hypothetical protein
MESKKINQLATELAPALSDLTIIGDPTTGISKKITLSQMASLFTGTVEEYANLASFPLVGAADTIYIALDTNVLYRWNTGTNAYVELSPNIINSLVFNDANGFDGTISLVGSVATLTITTALTTGSIGFIGASGALLEDNANFFWNNSTKRLGINTNAPTTAIDTFGSGIITRVNGTSTNNAFIGFASAGTNKWSVGNVQSDHRFRIYNEATTSELISVLQTGEFGIGIANPLTKLHIFGGASALIANLDANTSVAKSISYRSGNSSRINLEVSGTESGSNAGMDFFLRTYTDAGSLLETPFSIVRSTGITTIKSLTLTNALSIANGGTGLTSYTIGDLIFASGTTTLTKLADVATGNALISGGVGVAPSWGKIGLTTHVSGTLPIANGGTGSTTQNFVDLTNTQTVAGLKTFTNGINTNAYSSLYGLRISGNDTTNTIYAGNVSMGITADSGNTIFIGQSNGTTGFRVFTSSGGATFSSSVSSGGYLANGSITVGMPIDTGGTKAYFDASNINGAALTLRADGVGRTIRMTSDATGTVIGAIDANSNGLNIGTNTSHPIIFNPQAVERMRLFASGNVRFSSQVYNNTVASPRTLYIASDGELGGISSIRESKTNINKLDSSWLMQLNPVSFNYRKKDEDGKYINEYYDELFYGLIAEETELVNRDICTYNNDKLVGIEYSKLVPVLVKAIQEQQTQIEELKSK